MTYKKILQIILLFFITIGVFCAVLIPREVPLLKTLSVLARYDSTRVVPIVSILLLFSLSIKNERISIISTSVVVFTLLSLTLNGLWASAYTENNVIAGLVPRSDALSFYGGAVSLIERGYLVDYAQRRPLFGSFLGFILWLTGGNLQITLAILTYFLSLVIFLSVIEVRKDLSIPAAVLYMIVVFLFARRQIGITMSETLGLMLGVLALLNFLIFLRKEENKQKSSYQIFLLAVSLFALAQASRPGAVMTLPILIIYAGWLFYQNNKKVWIGFLITSLVILLVFAINSSIFHLITLPGGTQTNNIGYGIYGLVSGGKGWEQIFVDYPSIAQLPSGEIERQVMRLVWESLINHPEKFIQGMGVQFRILFSFQPTNSVYSFVWSKNTIINYVLISLLFIFSGIAILAIFFERRQKNKLLLSVFILGFLISLFVAPAYQQQYMRLYAVSIPFLGFLPAYGLNFAINSLPEKYRKLAFIAGAGKTHNSTNFSIFVSLAIIVILLVNPFLTKFFAPSLTPQQTIGCDDLQDEVIMPYYPGTSIKIYRNNPAIKTWVPIISQLDYKGSIHSICCGPQIEYFKNIAAPNVIYPALNLITGSTLYLITEESLLPEYYGLLHICGRIEDIYGKPAEEGFLYPYSIHIVERR